MSNDDAAQQLEEWKQKYYQSISSLEKQQSYEDLLQRSLARLALAAQGLDASLDKQLKSLRKVLRGNNDQKEIQYILDQMEKAIARMEVNKSQDSTQSSGEILADLLKSLKLRKPYKADARKLAKQLKLASSSEVSTILPELLLLLNSCLPDGTEKPARRFSFHLFGIGKPAKNDNQQQNKANESNSASLLNDEDDSPPFNIMLMQLLERLSLPTDLSKQATKLRLKLEKGIDDEDLPQAINEIADIVSTLGSMVITEKLEYQQFLTSLTTRLNELDQHIRETGDHNAEAFKEREIIGQAVEDEFVDLRNNVEGANDLEQLKSTVSERLDFLDQHFELYQKSDQNRFEQSQKEIIELNQRIQTMEQETTVLRESAEKSRNLALKDALTGIWNRQALNEILDKEFARWQRYQSPLSIVIWDVDFFKRVNDNYGHAAGDKVLRTIARIFQKATRDADFIARFGGEEFMGVFPETRLEDALTLANKIREKVELSKFHYEDKRVFVTASAGLATFRPGDSIDDVFKRADKALYQAKQGGRNRCVSDD
ncbi:MAG: GGDEF domain-containing protein [Proteobacteria bacterium]|nr:GGDEF domain-containing protein [Pseudomonadota bacterium]